jgi:hypothetical protein
MKHKNSEVIKAFADGKECEKWCEVQDKWFNVINFWDFDCYEKVRIKPKPKPDVVRYTGIGLDYADDASERKFPTDNLKLTFDGETNKLKSAEVIK